MRSYASRESGAPCSPRFLKARTTSGIPRVAEALLELPAQARQEPPRLDDPGQPRTGHGPFPLEEPPPLGLRTLSPANFPRRPALRLCPPRRSPYARQRRAIVARGGPCRRDQDPAPRFPPHSAPEPPAATPGRYPAPGACRPRAAALPTPPRGSHGSPRYGARAGGSEAGGRARRLSPWSAHAAQRSVHQLAIHSNTVRQVMHPKWCERKRRPSQLDAFRLVISKLVSADELTAVRVATEGAV
jgi:hypothetical protein